MNDVYREHSLQECQSWLRELDFLVMEVSFLKTRLSHVVDTSSRRSLIASAESYQNDFIRIEEGVKRLLAEVKFQNEQLVYTKGLVDANTSSRIVKSQEYLRSAMIKLEAEFSGIRKTFNQWVINSILLS